MALWPSKLKIIFPLSFADSVWVIKLFFNHRMAVLLKTKSKMDLLKASTGELSIEQTNNWYSR